MELPKKKKRADTDLAQYTGLIYGREKIGKTTFLSTFPDALFLTTEPGTKGLEIYEIPIKTWTDLLKAVKLLENDNRFKTVIIDTIDNAYDLCLEYVCKRSGIEYPGEDERGKKDYGKSWKKIRMEFLRVINRILNTGRGLWFTSHVRETELNSRSGQRWDRIHPSMAGQARAVIEALVDMFIYAEYMRDKDGNTIRVLICQGDETVWAGHRQAGTGKGLPPILPLNKEDGYGVLNEAFKSGEGGLDPVSLKPAKETSEIAGKYVKGFMARTKATKKKKPIRRKTK